MAGRGRGDGGPALDAVLYGPFGLGVDTGGNVFLGDWQILVTSRIRKVDGSGTISTVAGGTASSDEGALSSPYGGLISVTPDSAGNLWVADPSYNRVQRVSPSGDITTVAGTGTAGFSGDGGPATAAQLSFPYGVAVDSAGIAYVADASNNRVRRIDTSGIITTVAGDGETGSSGDGGPATGARLAQPKHVAVDGSGRLYIADGDLVRRIDGAGIITTVAGNGSRAFSGDGGPATAAGIEPIAGLAVDPPGNLYVAEPSRVRKVDTSGIIGTVAGTGEAGWSAGSGPATAQSIGAVSGIATDGSGTLYIGDFLSHRVRKVTGSTISTFAGGGRADVGDGGPATAARLAAPAGIATGPDGSLYIADPDDHRIRRVDRSGVVHAVAGTGVPGFGGDGGPATAAQLLGPIGVAADGAGNVYISDSGNNRIRWIDPGGLIHTLAGNGTPTSSGDGGPASSSTLTYPYLMTVDDSGAVYVSESSRVRRIDPGGAISTVAGTGVPGYSGDGGPATAAGLSNPLGLVVDGAGNLFIGDGASVRRVDTSGVISTVAGTGTPGYSGDGGPATGAQIMIAAGVAVDASGNLYFADALNWRVRRVDPNGVISTVAGNGEPGESGDGGPATAASFDFPYGVVVDGSDLIVSIPYNSHVLRVEGVADAGPGNDDDNVDPEWTDWHFGDVHAHAAGDDNLKIHPQCENQRTEAACAEYLVHNVLARAKRFDTQWIVFTEHGPWLGFQRQNEVNLYDAAQAEREWTLIKAQLDGQSTSEVRGLIGEELGTAAPSCSVVAGRNGPLRSPGHFGVYYTPTFIDNSMVDCNETGENGYADDAQEVGAWGGVNHPDNDDGGSPWNCYGTEVGPDGHMQGAEHQPQLLRSKRCAVGLDQYAVSAAGNDGSFRTMEVINGGDLPSAKTLGLWDMYLQNGYQLAAVGGGDGHTAPRQFKKGDAVKCLLLLFGRSMGECVDDSAPEKNGNHDKVGGSGRTLAQYPAGQPAVTPGSYNSDAEADPARVAIRQGRTVATNGPEMTAQVAGAYPGATVDVVAGRKVPVRVDWLPTFKTVGDSYGLSTDGQNRSDVPDFDSIPGNGEELQVEDEDVHVPDRIVVVTGSRAGCGARRVTCAADTRRTTIDLAGASDSADLSLHLDAHWAEVMVDVPGPDSYVRVELYHDVRGQNPHNTETDRDDDDLPRFVDGRQYDFAAFTSPIYLHQASNVRIGGRVLDGPSGNPVDGAAVELCRTDGVAVCVSRTSGADGTFPELESLAGTWAARAFPPAGATDRGYASTTIGTVGAGASRSVTLDIPANSDPYIDPAGRVVDTEGRPLPGATVQLWTGAELQGPFAPVAAGAAVMSPANRRNPVVTGDSGAFAWDTLTGFYKVTATKSGCVSLDGDPAADSGSFRVPPPVVDVELVLDCRPADTKSPIIAVKSAPKDLTNQRDARVAFTVTDAQPGSVAYCYLDGGPDIEAGPTGDGVAPPGTEPCTSPYIVTGLADGRHRVTLVAIDGHDNGAVKEIAFTVDATPPVVTVVGVTEGATYPTDSAPTPSCQATDATSGLAGPCRGKVSPAGSGVGTYSYTAKAADRAGNTTTVTVTWRIGYRFDGFFRPVSNPPSRNRVQAGRAVPVRFSLGGYQGMDVMADRSPSSRTISCASPAPVEVVGETTIADKSLLIYNPLTRIYTYLWKTDRTWAGTCRELNVRLDDGTDHVLAFELR